MYIAQKSLEIEFYSVWNSNPPTHVVNHIVKGWRASVCLCKGDWIFFSSNIATWYPSFRSSFKFNIGCKNIGPLISRIRSQKLLSFHRVHECLFCLSFNANRNHNNCIVNFILTNIPGNRFILFRSNSPCLKMDVYHPLLMLIGMSVDPTYSRALFSMPISELCTIFLKQLNEVIH